MLKSLRLGTALIAVLTTQLSTTFLAEPASAVDMATLSAQAEQALCSQNWGEAVKIINEIIAATPSNNQTQRNQLEMVRGRIQRLYDSRFYSPNPPDGCSTETVATPSVATNTNTNVMLGQSPETIESYFGTPLHRGNNLYIYRVGGLGRLFPQSTWLFVEFFSGRAHSISLHFEGRGVPYSRTQASEFFYYIFGYQPPNWTLLSRTPIAHQYGNYSNVFYNTYSICMDVGVATVFTNEEKQILLGDTRSLWVTSTNTFGLLSEPRCK